MRQTHNGKIALITGANKGIGFEVARGLSQQGITVLVGARNPGLGQEAAARLNAEFIELDVTQPATITAAAETIQKRHGRLDILVNNAGIVQPSDGPPSKADPAAILLGHRIQAIH